LQKFISLCDAQRKIEGVYRGKTRTYDFRGKKVVVVMAGNPYTESGEKFKIPDMLANRADTYNLGEIIGGSRDAFVMSYLENCLTSNPVLDKLAARSQKDVYGLIRMAETDSAEGVNFEGNYSLIEQNEMITVMRKLMRVRDVVLKVNEEYIRSAGTSDDYRTEPAFKLQGSYRNMNRIAERVVAVMNDDELEELILTNYRNDAQTLTTGMESNLLKFKQLAGCLSPDEAQRWEDICRTFQRNVRLRGVGEDDKVGLVITELGSLADGLDAIRKALGSGLERLLAPAEAPPVESPPLRATFGPEALDAMKQFADGLRAALAEQAKNLAAKTDQPPQEIQVISKVPTAILNVVRQQFRLMEGWLAPLANNALQQSEEVQHLRTLMTENMEAHQRLITLLEEGLARDEQMLDKLAKHKIAVERTAKKSEPKPEPPPKKP
ncbi:MAG: AAA family ATPase, partial [Pirellulaceae bacterium]|nr:AAA family ATPase [Pirellulaceae bacterium]